MLVGVQLSVLGLYLPPLYKVQLPPHPYPPQTIISLPVHTAVWDCLAEGALTVLVGIQLSSVGLYFPPVFVSLGELKPPQTVISVPVHTAL